MRNLAFLIIALVSGAVLPLQALFNVQVGKSMKEPVFAAFVSFLVGTVGLLVYLLIVRFNFSNLTPLKSLNWYVWVAGLLGAFYVVAVILSTEKLGTALTFGLVVTGQMTLSIVLDHYGLFGSPVNKITWQKLLGVVFLISGVVLIRK